MGVQRGIPVTPASLPARMPRSAGASPALCWQSRAQQDGQRPSGRVHHQAKTGTLRSAHPASPWNISRAAYSAVMASQYSKPKSSGRRLSGEIPRSGDSGEFVNSEPELLPMMGAKECAIRLPTGKLTSNRGVNRFIFSGRMSLIQGMFILDSSVGWEGAGVSPSSPALLPQGEGRTHLSLQERCRGRGRALTLTEVFRLFCNEA